MKIDKGGEEGEGSMKIQQKKETDEEADFFSEEERDEECITETGGCTLQKHRHRRQSTPRICKISKQRRSALPQKDNGGECHRRGRR